MNTPTWMVDGKPGKILELLPKLARAVGAVPKRHSAPGAKWKFRSIDDLLVRMQPAMVRLGIVTAFEVTEQKRERWGGHTHRVELRLQVSYIAPDGSYVVSLSSGEALDESDKATNKAITAAIKNAHLHTLQVPTGTRRDIEHFAPSKWSAKARAVIVQVERAESMEEITAVLDGPAVRGLLEPERGDVVQVATSKWRQLAARKPAGGKDDWPKHDFAMPTAAQGGTEK